MTLYPTVPSAPPEEPQNHRLQQISQLQQRLETEREKRASLYKKYRRGVNVCDGIDTTLVTISLGLGAAGIGLLSTIVSAPVVVALEAAATVCGLTGLAGKYIARRLQRKAKKHDEIRMLAEAKLNTIADHISKALQDDNISDKEFGLILSEVEKFTKMKDKIRKGKIVEVGLSDEEKKQLIEEGKAMALSSMRQKLAVDLQ